MTVYDVIIVGGGPAGGMAAYRLATSGARVLLLEKSAYPRDKACGDMLSEHAIRSLEQMGMTNLISRYSPLEVWRAGVGDPSGYVHLRNIETHRNGKLVLLTIPRCVLDAAIIEQAQSAGSQVLEKASVTNVQVGADRVCVQASGLKKEIRGRLLIIATGSMSKFSLGRPGLFAIRGYYYSQRTDDHDVDFRWLPDIAPGYIWKFPNEGQRLNIGVYTTRERLSELRPDECLSQSSLVRGHLLTDHLRGGWINVSFGRHPTFADRTLYIGDAAGLCQPHLGEGISPALRSGEIAARYAIRALDQNRLSASDLSEYMKLLHKEFDWELRFSRSVYKVMNHSRFLSVIATPLLTLVGAVIPKLLRTLHPPASLPS